MNNLEWINEQIEECKQSIKECKKRIREDKEYPSLVKCHQTNLEELTMFNKHLNQIKTELEAWKVVKPNIKYEEAENDEGVYMEYILYLEIEEWKPEAFKIKKALEVKDA